MKHVTEEVLERIERGHLRLEIDHDSQEPVVYGFHSVRKTWQVIKPVPHKDDGRMRFNVGPKRRPIYRNVMVWMLVHRRIPVGVIDHKDLNRLNDHPSNLQEMSKYESDRQGRDVQEEKALNRLLGWFDHIIHHGVEPEEVMA